MLVAEASTGDSKKGHEWGFLNYRIRLYFVCPEFFGPCKCFQFATPFELTKLTKIRDFDQNHEFLSVLSTQKELQIENICMGQKIPDIQNTTLFCNLKSPTRGLFLSHQCSPQPPACKSPTYSLTSITGSNQWPIL